MAAAVGAERRRLWQRRRLKRSCGGGSGSDDGGGRQQSTAGVAKTAAMAVAGAEAAVAVADVVFHVCQKEGEGWMLCST